MLLKVCSNEQVKEEDKLSYQMHISSTLKIVALNFNTPPQQVDASDSGPILQNKFWQIRGQHHQSVFFISFKSVTFGQILKLGILSKLLSFGHKLGRNFFTEESIDGAYNNGSLVVFVPLANLTRAFTIIGRALLTRKLAGLQS